MNSKTDKSASEFSRPPQTPPDSLDGQCAECGRGERTDPHFQPNETRCGEENLPKQKADPVTPHSIDIEAAARVALAAYTGKEIAGDEVALDDMKNALEAAAPHLQVAAGKDLGEVASSSPPPQPSPQTRAGSKGGA